MYEFEIMNKATGETFLAFGYSWSDVSKGDNNLTCLRCDFVD
jgi:hypothetical protein